MNDYVRLLTGFFNFDDSSRLLNWWLFFVHDLLVLVLISLLDVHDVFEVGGALELVVLGVVGCGGDYVLELAFFFELLLQFLFLVRNLQLDFIRIIMGISLLGLKIIVFMAKFQLFLAFHRHRTLVGVLIPFVRAILYRYLGMILCFESPISFDFVLNEIQIGLIHLLGATINLSWSQIQMQLLLRYFRPFGGVTTFILTSNFG